MIKNFDQKVKVEKKIQNMIDFRRKMW